MFLRNINQLIFEMVKFCVFYEERNEFLNTPVFETRVYFTGSKMAILKLICRSEVRIRRKNKRKDDDVKMQSVGILEVFKMLLKYDALKNEENKIEFYWLEKYRL
jgi:hypothetical protein